VRPVGSGLSAVVVSVNLIMVTILCSADWQLGMRRRFFGADAQARYTQARLDVIDRLAVLARERSADALVVAGDVFDANQVERHVVLRAAEALRDVGCPVFLLPGNHDSLEPGNVWHSAQWRRAVPPNVTVLTDEPVVVGSGDDTVEIVGAPWRTRRPATDPLGDLLSRLRPGRRRLIVGHGRVDTLTPEQELPPIELAVVERALSDGRADLVILGDRHSTTEVGTSGRIWYPGTPEVTDTDEVDPGNVLVATFSNAAVPEAAATVAGSVDVESVHIGRWHMLEHVVELDGSAALDELEAWFGGLPDKTRTYLRLGAIGSLDVADSMRLELLLDSLGEVLGGISRSKHWDVRPRPDDAALDALGLTGPAKATLLDLQAAARTGDDTAAHALTLLHRLVLGAA
jgi:DNA repair exonuclease SbcCD nuclease subunit